MEFKHFTAKDNETLLVFFCGFGLDYRPFSSLFNDKIGTLFIYNYSHTDFYDVEKIVVQYREIILAGYSFGVYMSGLFCSRLSDDAAGKIRKYIVINGTYLPVDPLYGIPERIFNITLTGMEKKGVDGFYKNLFNNDAEYSRFLLYKPEARDFAGELRYLGEISANRLVSRINPDIAIISKNDRIFSPENQKRYWSKAGVHMDTIEASHFPFYSNSLSNTFFQSLFTGRI